MMARAWLFPGQGSQRGGMGADLFARYPGLVSDADDILGYSVREACEAREAGNRLSDTASVQPLMFVVNALHLRSAVEEAPPPDYLAGHSLGEISALYAAGCLDFAAGLDLVRHRGVLMAACPPGAMMAVLGVPAQRLAEILADGAFASVEIANHNLPDQIVVAGPDAEIRRLAAAIGDRGLGKTVRLNVSVAAHSRYMRPAVDAFTAVLDGIAFAPPAIPVFCASTGELHDADAPSLRSRLAGQLTERVRWWDVMTALSRAGVTGIREVGPGEVLSRMWQRGQPSLPAPSPAVPAPSPASRSGHDWFSVLGDPRVTQAYRLRLPYLADALPYGISGPVMLRRLADAGLFGFLGTRGVPLAAVAADIRELTAPGLYGRWGIELPAERLDPPRARALACLAADAGVRHAVTAGWSGVSAELVHWRFAHGSAGRRLLVRITGHQQAQAFLRPAPAGLIAELLRSGRLTPGEAAAAARLPVATDLCVQPEPGSTAMAGLLPAVLRAAREAGAAGEAEVLVGAGGIATPEEAATAMLLGAGFLVTAAINQCTPQARTCEAVKDLLATVRQEDTVLAPSAELFLLGGQEHMVRKATLFPARAAHLYGLHLARVPLRQLPAATRQLIERDYLGEPIGHAVGKENKENEPRMADVLARYFDTGTSAALEGRGEQRLNWHIPCDPELGAFNLAASRLGLVSWRTRDVEVIAERLTVAGAELLGQRLRDMLRLAGDLTGAAAQS